MIVFETTQGPIKIELFEKEAPASAANFKQYVEEGFFDGLIFHRVIPGFVIQGGGFEPGMNKRPTRAPIRNEAGNGLKNERGTLSMARTSDPDSATSQFFINLVDNKSLDKRPGSDGYAVFGKVVEGMETVYAIAQVDTGNVGMYDDVPMEDIMILAAKVE